MSPVKVLKDLMKGVLSTLKGSPFSKKAYDELFKVLYEFLRLARQDGLIALEPHLANPHESSIFHKYPLIGNNHHVSDFICGAFSPAVEGSATPEQLEALLEIDLKTIEEEHHGPLGVLSKTADGLPGFGIVAAVLGIVITMGAIDGPVTEIGEKVGAALVGTFLGILASYGFIGPLVGRMESMGARGVGVLPDDFVGGAGVREESAAEGGHRPGPPRLGQQSAAVARGARSIVQSSGK